MRLRHPLCAVLAAVIALTGAFDSAEANRSYTKRWAAKARIVKTDFGLAPGTIVIVNQTRRLYHVLGQRRSKRYRIAVGERIELWTGRTFVSQKKVDPDWTPLDGSPKIEGGKPHNPLGRRALYLDWGLLRIHGNSNRRSIGRAVSNGCIRMYNRDVEELFEAVHLGAPVIAVNRTRDIWKFKEPEFTGKLPAWDGQDALWQERKKDKEKRAAGRSG